MSNQNIDTLCHKLSLDFESASPIFNSFIRSTIEQVRPYCGNWEFSWLLSDWNSTVWITNEGKKTRKNESGDWINTFNVRWDIRLPDGSSLTDPKYAFLLESCRRLSALHRSGFLNGSIPSTSSVRGFTLGLKNICVWLVLESARYRPSEHGFKLLDEMGIRRIFSLLKKGGWGRAHALVDRCLVKLHYEVFKEAVPQVILENPNCLPEEYCTEVIGWLKRNDGFVHARNKNMGYVSRELIGRLISSNTRALQNRLELNVFLRQFEKSKHKIIMSNNSTREYAIHNGHLSEDMDKEQCVAIRAAAIFNNIFELYRHAPDRLPSPATINLQSIIAQSQLRSQESTHTPFIPIDTALTYLNEALRWIVLYGDDLIAYYLDVMRYVAPKFAMPMQKKRSMISANNGLEKVFLAVPVPKNLLKAGFKFNSLTPAPGTTNDYDRMRNNPSLQEALEILVGAITIVIALLKPSRDIEITTLPRLCLIRSSDGHYWLDSDLAKRTRAERRSRTGGKPIPAITARAILQIRSLNRGLIKIFKESDSYKKELLFYLPNPKKWGAGIKIGSSTLNSYIDKFCDYVDIPPDELGRRWYLRIHEMRKWFLLLLFWSGRYQVLDAARWIAGHTNETHLYAYIEREFPDGKLGKLEAECAIDQLAKYDSTRVVSDGQDVSIVEFHQRILRHFKVESLTFVKESEWCSLVEELFEDEFHLEPYSICDDIGGTKFFIAIRVGPRGEKF